MRKLGLLLLIIFSPLSLADSAENYRSAFLTQCNDNGDDAQSLAMCQCVFNNWLAQLPSKTEASAVTAAKLIANIEGDYQPSEMISASAHLGQMQNISLQCADKVLGTINLGGYENDSSADDNSDTVNLPASSQTSKSKRGLLGAVVGWAGKKAGLPDAINEAAADTVDNNEDTIRGKLNPLKSRFNPFKKDE